jgi:hypothetical protein
MVIAKISPIYPPFGIPPQHRDNVIPKAVNSVIGSVKSLPNMAKITAILIIDDILEPSLCNGAPNGIATLIYVVLAFFQLLLD